VSAVTTSSSNSSSANTEKEIAERGPREIAPDRHRLCYYLVISVDVLQRY
jgi:hypothetical protein